MRSRLVFTGLGAVLASLLSACSTGEPTAEATPSATSTCPSTRVKDTDFSTSKFDWRLTFSEDRRTAFWAVSDEFFPFSRKAKIVTANYENGAWSPPQDAPFSGPTYSDIDPVIAPDGKTLFFSSIRPVGGEERRDLDLWYVKREGDGWGDPVHLGDQVNSPRDELYASVAEDGTLYFGSDREGQWDIYRSRPNADGTYGPAERLPAPVNSDDVWEFNPDISPDGQTLVFTILNGPDGLGEGDIYLARRQGDGFDTPVNLGRCVNSSRDEYHPTVVWAEQPVLYYVRQGDFYRVDLPRG
ncbi:MAG: PD40 domain-containing protein [Micromonosporaceae bacterium]|nr:PD40 domain-containing protein [Micromonosporaceae bacterium]